jgi:asparagine synthase (glutamine-hydrolysing)
MWRELSVDNILPGFMGFCDLKLEKALRDSAEWLSCCTHNKQNTRVVCSGPYVYMVAFGTEHDHVHAFELAGISGVFHGELFRPDRIRSALLSCGYTSVESLGNLIATVYMHEGLKGVCNLEGIFSLALWDSKSKKLLLYRDSSCFKYLYYNANPAHGLTFSTQLPLLFARPHVIKKFSRPSLHEYLRTLEVYPPNTIYQDIYSVEPGGGVGYDEHGLTNSPSYGSPTENQVTISFGEAVEALDELLTESVRKRLSVKSTTGFFLSGGVDSSLLCGIGAKLTEGNIDAFTVGFDDPAYNEMGIAGRIADACGIRHHKLFFSMEDYEDTFPRFYKCIDQPFSDPAALSTFLAYEYLRDKVDAVIDGTGADTLVGTMPPRYKRIAVEYASLLPYELRKMMMGIVKKTPVISGYYPILDFDEPQEVLSRWKGWTRREIESLCDEKVSLEHTKFYKIYASYPLGEHFDRYSAIIRNTSDDRIHEPARLTGILTRFPYWDSDVEQFVHGLPRDFRYKKGEQKRILKAVLERYVDRDIWDVPKRTFNFPFVDFMRRDKCKLVNELLCESALKKHGLFNPKPIVAAIAAFKSGDEKVSFKLWALLIFQYWLNHHAD